MELRMLQYFLAVVEEENISRAADVLHVTQPTLSRQMAQLEDELGTRLFIRGKQLTLTEAGVMLRHRAEEILAIVKKVENEIADKEELCGVISIGSGGLNASYMLPVIMEGFRKKYPKVRYQLYTNSADYIKEQLEQGVLDLGILLEPVDITKFDYIRMNHTEKWGLLVRAGHPLAKKRHIKKEDLLGEPLIITNRELLQKELENWLGDSFSKLDIFSTYNIITNVAMLVDSGVASAITIEGAVNLFTGNRMVFRPLEPELTMSSVIVWKKAHVESGVAGRFIEYLKCML